MDAGKKVGGRVQTQGAFPRASTLAAIMITAAGIKLEKLFMYELDLYKIMKDYLKGKNIDVPERVWLVTTAEASTTAIACQNGGHGDSPSTGRV